MLMITFRNFELSDALILHTVNLLDVIAMQVTYSSVQKQVENTAEITNEDDSPWQLDLIMSKAWP